ncbi:MAG: polyribonucleotide nucleotidyltransferase [Deltaproteobacteria bacterium]|nr:MAG: polyribonucleotide nucleotidyltransferase [Deltaproteobacteria bacterium]
MNEVSRSVEIGDHTLTFTTGRYARQASGAVVVSCGDSKVLVTGTTQRGGRPFDFLPLTVDYQDRNGSFGTIPGGFFKREGRSNEREILISRMIDRPIRPLFPKNFRQELQIIATVMSFDKDHETDVLAFNGASAAFHISEAPLSEPAAAVRICRVGGELKLNPNFNDREAADIELIIAGTRSAITMVEGGANEASEDVMLDIFDLAQENIRKIIEVIDELRAVAGQPKIQVEPPAELDAGIKAYVDEHGPAKVREGLAIKGKHERSATLKEFRNALIEAYLATQSDLSDEDVERLTNDGKAAWDGCLRHTMRTDVIQTGKRLDGRSTDQIRHIWIDTAVAPRAHGSAIFTRGETQAYVTTALGTDIDAQRLELPIGRTERRFMLTYNFPPFCTGEARPLRGPKRREVGHGALARRGLLPVLPDHDDFPYVYRCTSEILESNGSSSMATVCGSSLALMDAGVPLKAPVAGIAMGLIKEGDDFAVLSDILGDEDHLGDMDFKVTGTRKGITAFQMDCKVKGVSREVMAKAMEQARQGRLHILDKMEEVLAAPREDLSRYAPRITTLHIKSDKIRDLIGPGGKVIRGIQEACDVRVTVDDSGKVDVASSDPDSTDKAIRMIREITQEAEIGALYVGIVKRVVDFGAFVEIFPGTDGLIHISHLAQERVENVTDVLNEGDEVLVRVIDIDRSGKIRLSRKEALAAS